MPNRYGRATRAALERIKANHKILETAGVNDELDDKTSGELLVELSAFVREYYKTQNRTHSLRMGEHAVQSTALETIHALMWQDHAEGKREQPDVKVDDNDSR